MTERADEVGGQDQSYCNIGRGILWDDYDNQTKLLNETAACDGNHWRAKPEGKCTRKVRAAIFSHAPLLASCRATKREGLCADVLLQKKIRYLCQNLNARGKVSLYVGAYIKWIQVGMWHGPLPWRRS